MLFGKRQQLLLQLLLTRSHLCTLVRAFRALGMQRVRLDWKPAELDRVTMATTMQLVAREFGPSDTRLVAYVVSEGATSSADLRRHLGQTLPPLHALHQVAQAVGTAPDHALAQRGAGAW